MRTAVELVSDNWGCALALLAALAWRANQKSALPGVRGKGMTSRLSAMPVMPRFAGQSVERPRSAALERVAMQFFLSVSEYGVCKKA
jgi:hypothetical protein